MKRVKPNIIYEDSYLIIVYKDSNQVINEKDMIPLIDLSKEISGIIPVLKVNRKYDIKYSYLLIVEGYLEDNICECNIINKKEKYSILTYTTSNNDLYVRKKFKNIGHPIIGDYRNKSGLNPIGRIAMHLYKIQIDDKTIYSNIPDSFNIFYFWK